MLITRASRETSITMVCRDNDPLQLEKNRFVGSMRSSSHLDY